MNSLKLLLVIALFFISSHVLGLDVDKGVENGGQLDLVNKSWEPFTIGNPLKGGSEIRTAGKELHLYFSEGSMVRLKPFTTISIGSLLDPLNQPVMNITLKKGEIRIQMALYNFYRKLVVMSGQARVMTSESEPIFSVKHNALTTVSVEKGALIIQFDDPKFQSIDLHSGEQISFNASKIGPIVTVEAPASLEEPGSLGNQKH